MVGFIVTNGNQQDMWSDEIGVCAQITNITSSPIVTTMKGALVTPRQERTSSF